jgi:hypothetical protein
LLGLRLCIHSLASPAGKNYSYIHITLHLFYKIIP